MARFRLFLLLMFIFNSSSGFKTCSNQLPGLRRLLKGYHMTKFSDQDAEASFGRDLFQFSCNENVQFLDLDLNAPYDIPDQFQMPIYIPECVQNEKSEVHNNYFEHRKYVQEAYGFRIPEYYDILPQDILDLNYVKHSPNYHGFLSLGADLEDAKKAYFWWNNFTHTMSAKMTTFKVSFNPEKRHFSEFFINETKNLVKYELGTQKSDRQMFKFIRTFGTHYFKTAIFGGKAYQRISIHNNARKQITKFELDLKAEANFDQHFKINGGFKIKDEENDESFLKEVDYEHYQLCGNESDSMEKWFTAMHSAPWIIGGDLGSIDDLVEDEKVRNALRLANLIHQLKAGAREMVGLFVNTKLRIAAEHLFGDSARESANRLIELINSHKLSIDVARDLKSGIRLMQKVVEVSHTFERAYSIWNVANEMMEKLKETCYPDHIFEHFCACYANLMDYHHEHSLIDYTLRFVSNSTLHIQGPYSLLIQVQELLEQKVLPCYRAQYGN